MNSEEKNFIWQKKWETVSFYTYCLSTLFMIFFSISAIQTWPYPWNRISVLIACLFPLMLVFIWKVQEWIKDRELRKEYLFIIVLIILAICNIAFSENRFITLKVMVLFIISGMGAFVITSSLLTTKFKQTVFLWLSLACLLALCGYGMLEYINKKGLGALYPIVLFSSNPIPAGSLLILLFIGPFLLLPSSSRWLWFFQLSSILFGVVIILLIGKHGPILTLLVMAFLTAFLLPGRKLWVIPLIALILVGTAYKMQNHLPSTLKKNLITNSSTIFRLENYSLAFHILLKKPLLGIGLHVPLNCYLGDYRQKIAKDERYHEFIKEKKTFENMILCLFVEMGGLFGITYIALIVYLLRNLFRSIRAKPERRLQAILLLIPLAGFFVHSMTFDSLIYPHLNWLFHSYLGLMANFDKI